ncbi:hypothetical protein [Delftia sp. HK171]|uniref:hypothetical protein n=1 Tax=Delftia sp. HK171 TaxID=1920191 RepID=UPI001154B76F|nr:hypothetical protein [Delftia sp. HK171]
MQVNDMCSQEKFESADASIEPPSTTGQGMDAMALEEAIALCRSFYPHRSVGVGEALVLGFVLQNFQAFKCYLHTHPKNLHMSAERWISSAIMSCNESSVHSETADMLGVLGDSDLIDRWKGWKNELAAEKKAAGNKLAATIKKSKLKINGG